MNAHNEGLRVTLIPVDNQAGTQLRNTSTNEIVEEFINSNNQQENLKAAQVWLAEHGFVHAGGSDYKKYEPLMTGDTSFSDYE